MIEDFINNTMAGINNPECAFFVGNTVGAMSIAYVFYRVILIYYAIKLLDKLIFKGIPMFINFVNNRKKKRSVRR